jgi:RNA-directed DNA polymerase
MQEVLLIVRSYGFQLAQHKTRIMPRSKRQIITGIVVNEKLALPKDTRRKLRAMRHKLQKESVGEHRGQVINGHVAHAQSVEDGNDVNSF